MTYVAGIFIGGGRYGTGKTTLMDLLGSTKTRKINLFRNPTYRDQRLNMEWFALYHIENDIFVIEGFGPDLISNLDNLPQGISNEYSFSIRYNFAEQQVRYHEYIQLQEVMREGQRLTLDSVFHSLYMINEKQRDWFTGNAVMDGHDHYVGFKRGYLNDPSYSNLYSFMSRESQALEPDFAALDPVCLLELQDNLFEPFIFSDEKLAAFDLNLYQDKSKAYYFNFLKTGEEWTVRKLFVIRYLEMLVIDIWMNLCKKLLTDEVLVSCAAEIENMEFSSDHYEARVNYLYDVISCFERVRTGNGDPDWAYFDLTAIRRFIAALNQLEDQQFISTKKINAAVNEGFNSDVYEWLKCIDKERKRLHGAYFMFRVQFKNLSAGELEFINGFANLHTAIEIAIESNEIDTLLLLLDEPDASFHPEWSRRYIYNLVAFLNSIDVGRRVNYQIVISTH